MERILARRFSPFNFSSVPGFPNVVPTMDEWGDFLPIFRERKEDNPAEHLREFHELMHQWEIHHEDVLLNMFMFSLAGDAREWYHSLPPASISSLGEFHAAFNRHCQKFYSSKLICHNCCEEYKDCVQGMTVSNESCENESYEDESCEEEGYTSDELVKLVQALSAKIEKLEADRACCSYEGDAEDILVLETDVLGSPAYEEEIFADTDQKQPTFDGYPSENDEEQSFSMLPNMIVGSVDDYIAMDVLFSAPDTPVVSDLEEEIVVEEDSSLFLQEVFHNVFLPRIEEKNQEITPFLQDGGILRSPLFNECSDEEQQISTPHFSDLGSNQPEYDSYESDSDVDMKDFQDHTIEPFPLYIKEEHCVEINHLGPAKDTEQHDREEEPSMDIHEETSCSQLADVIGADKGEMEELKVQFISCLEPVNEKVSPGISRPASVLYPPIHSENIKRWVSNHEEQEVISYQSSFPDYKFCDPVGLYMELCFPKALEPAKLFILSSFGGISSVPIHVFFMLSYFPYLLWIICSKEKNYITEQSRWLWWKFAFT
jgi:hypothetical protein